MLSGGPDTIRLLFCYYPDTGTYNQQHLSEQVRYYDFFLNPNWYQYRMLLLCKYEYKCNYLDLLIPVVKLKVTNVLYHLTIILYQNTININVFITK